MKIKKKYSVSLDNDIVIFSINKKQCLQSCFFYKTTENLYNTN